MTKIVIIAMNSIKAKAEERLEQLWRTLGNIKDDKSKYHV